MQLWACWTLALFILRTSSYAENMEPNYREQKYRAFEAATRIAITKTTFLLCMSLQSDYTTEIIFS